MISNKKINKVLNMQKVPMGCIGTCKIVKTNGYINQKVAPT